jgi:hypothetical protein
LTAPTSDLNLRLAAIEARLTQLTDTVQALQARVDQLAPNLTPKLELSEDPL